MDYAITAKREGQRYTAVAGPRGVLLIKCNIGDLVMWEDYERLQKRLEQGIFRRFWNWLGFGKNTAKARLEKESAGHDEMDREARYLKLLEMQEEKRKKWGLSK